jgi:hypothetical protein
MGPDVSLEASLDAVVPLARHTFLAGDNVAFAVPSLGGAAALGVAYHFPK